MKVAEVRRTIFKTLLAHLRDEILELHQIGEEEPENVIAWKYAQQLEVLATEMVFDLRLTDDGEFAVRAHFWGSTFSDIRAIVDERFSESPHAGLKEAIETAINRAAAKLVAVDQP